DLVSEGVSSGEYRFTFSPLRMTPKRREEIFDKVKGWSPLPIPQNPATQIVRAGDRIALDLFVNPQTGQKIVEYIRVQGRPGRQLTAVGPPKNFSIEDVWLE